MSRKEHPTRDTPDKDIIYGIIASFRKTANSKQNQPS
jgi:hypothetical protein